MGLPVAYRPYFAAIADTCLALAGQPSRRLVIYPHVNADGDALGAAIGLGLLLEQCRVAVSIVTSEAVPSKLAFLPGSAQLQVYDDSPQFRESLLSQQAIALAIDCAAGDRLGRRRLLYEACPTRIVIDHHISELAPSNLILADTHAAATCEIVAFFGCYLEERLGQTLFNQQIAICLMTGLMTDTGRFSFSSTNERTFYAASLLMRYDVPTRVLAERLFDSLSPAKLRFMGAVAQGARFAHEGRFVCSVLSAETLAAIGGVETDLEGLVAMLRDVQGVELAILLREMPDGDIRGNVRSSERVDSQAFASHFGGGGHLRASGFTARQQTTETLLSEIFARAAEVFAALDQVEDEAQPDPLATPARRRPRPERLGVGVDDPVAPADDLSIAESLHQGEALSDREAGPDN